MKFLLLPVLYWTLAVSQIFAQKQLPVSIQPYSAHWSTAVNNMLHASGYEVPGSKSNVDFVNHFENRSEELQLDSIVSYYGYGIGLDSVPLYRSTFIYPNPYTRVILEDYFNQEQWIQLRRSTMTADNLGRMEETITEAYDTETGIYNPESRIRLYPRDNSLDLVDSFFIYEWSFANKTWDRQLAVLNKYDEFNRLTASKSSIEAFEVPFVFVDRYRYNDSGDLWQVESFIVDAEEEFSTGMKEYEYQDHLVVSASTYVNDGLNGFIIQSQIQYLYTPFKKEEQVQSYVFDYENQLWILTQVDAYGYDDEERVILKEVTTISAEGTIDRHQTRFNYVSDEYVALETEYFYESNTETWLPESKKYFYYDQLSAVDPDEPVKADALFLYPNPSSGVVQVKLTGKVSIYVYALTGQLVQQFQLAPGQTILDLSHLAAGMYQVRAKSDEDYYSGKLLIQ